LYRIDGAWFICLDKNLFQTRESKECTILSFGINTDPSFDISMVYNYKCRVESFDPFIEAKIFAIFRGKNPSLEAAVTLNIESNWSFHRIGIVGHDSKASNLNKIGGMGTLEQILTYTKLTNEVRDFHLFIWQVCFTMHRTFFGTFLDQ
jgi:hypothetical protein